MEPLLIIGIILLGPVIGSFIGVARRPTDRFMLAMLAFAAGIMLAISFLQLIPEGIRMSSTFLCMLGVTIGALVMYGSDRIIPHIHPGLCKHEEGRSMQAAVAYLLIGIFLHNFPEGIAIGVGTVTTFSLSLTLAIAIAIHDIPESICTAAPYYYLTRKRLKSFLVSVAIGLPAVAGYLFASVFFPLISQELLGVLIGLTAGLMIYICADELIPTSCKPGNHQTIFALVAGVLVVMVLGMI